MKTTNILLGIIALLLFFHLVKGTSFNLISEVSAQSKSNDQILKVKIIGIDPNVDFKVKPAATLNGRQIFPVCIVDKDGNIVNTNK